MKAAPNSEQIPAIRHRGGVLLRAGAGSGKTFVLTYHLVYFLNFYIDEFFKLPGTKDQDSFRSFIRQKMEKIVLMTFTKKAAGEISTRIVRRFSEEALEYSGECTYNPWDIIIENIEKIFIGTIDAFCFRLVKEGFVKELNSEAQMISVVEFQTIISDAIEKWMAQRMSTYPQFENHILSNIANLKTAMATILGDPELRNQWINFKVDANNITNEDVIVQNILDLALKNRSFKYNCDFSLINEKHQKAPWYLYLKQFSENFNFDIGSLEGVSKLHDLFSMKINVEGKIIRPSRSKDLSPEILAYYDFVKELEKFNKSYGEHLASYYQNYQNIILPWQKLLLDIFLFVENAYTKSNVLTFSDLEYYVYKELSSNSENRKAIQERYGYFIVDEFQDTSNVQYTILKYLINNDFNRLFVVGDAKQAIYGFRGGEVGVFQECERAIPTALSMTSNFRSLGNIVEFNNYFFDYIFKLGKEPDTEDRHSVVYEHQTIPEEKTDLGSIIKLNATLTDFHEPIDYSQNIILDYVEALAIREKILDNQKNYANECNAVLYQKLKPSKILIKLLIEANIGFTAQVKVPFEEDPIIGIFYTIIESKANKANRCVELRDFILNSYLSLLGVNVHNLEMAILKFEEAEKFFGLSQAVKLFFSELGINNSNANQNLGKILEIIKLSGSNKDKILKLLKEDSTNTYSVDFQFGTNPSAVQIMTAHASKGLEFDHVFCGGIYSNGKNMDIYPEIGTYPGAFQWSIEAKNKKRYRTPSLILEKIVNAEKNFSEKKRLFYVVGTRAIKTLNYVEINLQDLFGDKKINFGESWVKFFHDFQEENNFQPIIDVNLKISKNAIPVETKELFSQNFLSELANEVPLFHKDSLGIASSPNEGNHFLLLPEMSVTTMATVVECPRKFYFKQVLKLPSENLVEDQNEKYMPTDSEEIDIFNKPKNSSFRGTRIHEEISRSILSQFTEVPSDDVAQKVVEKIQSYVDKYDLISEKLIKFLMFNVMISGIPDLIMVPKNAIEMVEIWDFKTGINNNQKNEKYFFQLMCYAFAQFKLNKDLLDKKIKIVIYYVDYDLLLDKIVSFSEVENELFKYFLLLNNPQEINKDHCVGCEFKNLCCRNTIT